MKNLSWKILKLPVVDVNLKNPLFVLDNLKPYIEDIKRVYFMSNLKLGQYRGHHAHKKLIQLIIIISGSFEFALENESGEKDVVIINSGEALFIDRPVWRVFVPLEKSSSLITLCSDHYFEDDYIRNYQDFKEGKY